VSDIAILKTQRSRLPGMGIVQCDRALERKARRRTGFQALTVDVSTRVRNVKHAKPRVFSLQNRMRIALSPCWAGGGFNAQPLASKHPNHQSSQ
jgi:hypothetical protein